MAREKVTVTLDRAKLNRAKALIRAKSASATIDSALDRLLRTEQLRRDVAAYAKRPPTDEEVAIGDLPVELDLDDDEVDYDAIYGEGR